ncbi:PREDICTED: sacsin-like [Amphimedon queenslandica]|uniref:J domain-containing protein n=1 Tax=Amphimedon queenslandica TaxID=400682 RepID=A0AAN0JU26_AMPQE|nr:PREDICTED: sacsin-like [Amphimedon queenslandica]|eukprot:XP_019860387.1 PREDICTED: sacsin-like [Amphimedon queenslandica]
MAESHGPALIVHNNRTFTKEDFENITKLAGATKANQPLKIGKFGVGFCSVYHITDVPSFVSGEWLYIFDPTLKYLKGVVRNESRPGKKVQYQSKFLAQSQQMSPYEGLFGFKSTANYNGTIFRLPFRTSASQISSTIYDEHLIQQMKNDLIENGSKLLLFLQNVKRITFRSMQDDEVCISSINEENSIKHCITNSPASNSVSEYWLVSCHEEKLQTQRGDYQPGTASIACQLVKDNSSFECKAIEGSVFCFLPLSLPCTGLPVHVNANFAVMSNRSGIWTGASSGEPSDSREYWNKKLMTTIIPKAYCNLLKMMKDMCVTRNLVSYDFYVLWPLIRKLQTSYPWKDMVLVLIHLIENEKLFYSSVVCQWFTLASSQFFPLSLFEMQTCSILIEAAKILKLPLVLLPQDHVEQLPNPSIVSEDQFSQGFFDNISLFSDCIDTRNKILSAMLSVLGNGTAVPDKYMKLKNVLELHPCVPTSPDGLKLKLAEELVDLDEFCDMFDPEDGMFPQKSLYEDTLVREGISRLGLMSVVEVSWEVIISSARTVQPLIDTEEERALDRIKAIIECIEEKEDPAPPIINEISFLPVLPKPDKYFLPWKGDTHRLLPPSQMIAKESYSLKRTSLLLGSQKAIINTNSKGCGMISSHSLKLIGVTLHPSFNDVHNHFICLMKELHLSMSDDLEKIQLTEEICKLVYAYFESKITNSTSATGNLLTSKDSNQNPDSMRFQEILAEYCGKPFVWTGKCFVCPCDVSINWKHSEGPYLYKLPGILSQHKELVNCLKINKNFSTVKLLDVLNQMYAEFSPTCEIPESYRETADNIISDLNAFHKEDLEGLKENAILFDKSYILRPTKQLAFNDAQWLPPDNESNYVPSFLAREVALALGVEPTKSKFLEKYTSQSQKFSGVPFGQKEELTLRIKNILEDYPLDVTFLKELLQNADDAKATKMCVILDKRHHTAEKIPFKNGNDLKGPAILVWDDKEFTDENLEGIQKLGLGSKRDDNESVGQFGIGFNAVYHVTDCPSLYTRGNTLCVFDPHCKYIPGADELNPGRQLNTDKFFWDSMSDLRSFFLQDDFPDKPQNLDSGVLFRFPLRCTEEQVKNSKLVDHEKAKPLTADKMEELLNAWTVSIKESLLFLNHIIQFEYYIIESSSKVKCVRSYSVDLDADSLEKRKKFKGSSSSPFLVTYPVLLKTNLGANLFSEEHWLIQQGVGDIENPNKSWNSFNAIPKHGIAATLERSNDFRGQVFCFLPLPVFTHLPVHINGQFVLVSNRRSLWVNTTEEPDEKTKWNESLIKAIASSYTQFLANAKKYCFTLDKYDNLDELFDAVNKYYSLFPFWNPPFVYRKKEEKPETTFRSSGNITHSSGMPMPRFYPIVKKVDWKGICSLVFKLIWDSNAHLLATEMKKKTFSKNESNSKKDVWWTVEWHEFHNDNNPKKQAYFQSNTLQKEKKKVLRHLGMILTCAPHALYSHIQAEKINPAILSRESVYEYYCNFHSQIVTKCPCPITETPFESVENFIILLTYLLERSDDESSVTYVFPKVPDKVPLLLTADSHLRVFNTPSTVVCSKYSHIFGKSSFMFLHPNVIGKRLSSSYFSSELSLDTIEIIMSSNFKSALQSLEVENTNQDLIQKDELRGLWSCLKDDPIFSKHVSYIVKRWAIIPAKSGHLFSADSPILPLNMESSVDNDAFTKLVSLGVPQFDSMYSSCLAVDYCINLENYCKVLSILYHLHQKTQVLSNLRDVKETIQILFNYFGRINFKFESESLQIIKYLPLFEEVDGNFTNLSNKELYCWPSEASLTGYDEWNFSGSYVFLPANGQWTALCSDITTLGGSDLTERNLYIKFIFPNFKLLSSENRRKHLKHIKNTMLYDAMHDIEHASKSRRQSAVDFLYELKQLPCLEAKNGVLQPIRTFCDHNMEIFNVFSEHFYFVPEEYKDNNEWLEFLKALDLKVTVTIAEFEKFAKFVQSGHHKNISKASKVLVSYLFSDSAKEWHLNQDFLSCISCIRFVEVTNLDNLEWLAKSCNPPLYLVNESIGLTKLNEAVIYDSAALIWTVKPVINPPVPLYLRYDSKQYHVLQKKLGITLRPKVEDVFKNLEKISETDLAKFELFHKHDSRYSIREDSHRVEIKDIIEQSLRYLFECNAEEQLIKLKDISCIPVLASKSQRVLVKPLQVVRHMSVDCSHLFPYLHQLPSFLMGFEEELQLMGISDNITVKTLQYVLFTMHQQLSNTSLDRNTQTTVREAIIKLHKLLQTFQYSKKSIIEDISPLYFPNQDGILVKTTDLVFIDSHRYDKIGKKFSHSQYSLFILPTPAQNSLYDLVNTICKCLAAQSIEDFEPILEEYKIKSADFEILSAIESNPARIGGKIPDHRIDLLENDINHIFYPEEWVGFLNDEGNYIYVTVCYLVDQEVFNPLTKKYVISVDENDGKETVSTLDLYKLTKVKSTTSLEEGEDINQELVLFDPDSASARTTSDSDTVLQLKRIIFRDLQLIKGLEDEDEKRKAIKRLYKQYHPDRNADKKEIYEEAFKFLKRQVDRLYAGKELEDPDMANETLISAGSSSKPNAATFRRFYEEWEEDIKREKKASDNARERSNRMRQDDFFPDVSQPMPNSIEANFWIAQAESDLEAMLLLNEQIPFRRVQCQVLFQAHEACEKALKGGKYKLVGLNPASLKTHELHTHAAAIAGFKGGEWKVLPSLVCQIEGYYLKPRYPNQHSPSIAPVDVYSKSCEAHNVQEAVEAAKEVVKLIKKLF